MRLPSLKRSQPLRVTLYSKADCGLCREAEISARRVFGAGQVDVIDIIGDRQLEDEYLLRIPVLVVDRRVIAEGRITVVDARVALREARETTRSGARY